MNTYRTANGPVSHAEVPTRYFPCSSLDSASTFDKWLLIYCLFNVAVSWQDVIKRPVYGQ
jgi:hypothetical protein